MRLNLGTKLLVSYFIIVALLGVVAVVGIRSSRSTENAYADLVDRRAKVELTLANLSQDVIAAARDLAWYGISGDTSYLDKYQEKASDRQTQLRFLVDNIQSEEGKALLAKLTDADEKYWAVVDSHYTLFQTIWAGGNRVSADELTATAKEVQVERASMDAVSAENIQYQEKQTAAARAQAASDQKRSTALSVGIGAVSAAFGLTLGIWLSRSISLPVRHITAAAQSMAQGDLRVEQVTVRTGDEVQSLGEAFNAMAVNLRNVMAEIAQAGLAVASSADQLNAASGQTATASQQVAQAINEVAAGAGEQNRGTLQVASITGELRQAIGQVAAGATEQARHVQETAESTQQLSLAMAELTRTMEQIREAASQNGKSANDGLEAVNETVAGMERIRQAVAEATDRLKSLDNASHQIGQITEVITEIADQTNLLALNAAIEAARAGEHGKGFAVVAEEVRKLAERSANSTREISGLVDNIREGTRGLASAMERSNSEVVSGSGLAEQSGAVLRDVVETANGAVEAVSRVVDLAAGNAQAADASANSVSAMAAIVEENTAATEEMSASAEQVGAIVAQVARVAEDNAASAEEVAASVEEMSASVEEVAASAESLKQTADTLKQIVARFRL